MMNHKTNLTVAGLSAVLACGAVFLVGCGGQPPQQVAVAPPAPAPPPPPPPPAITSIEDLMAELNIDRRLVLPEDKAPNNNADRKAVLVFFDAMARGNSQSLKGMLPLADQMELNALVESGAWTETAARIQKVQIQTGSNSLGQKCALAVIEVGTGTDMTFQPQLWYYNTDQEDAVFEAAPTPPGIMDKLSGDWIAAWHQILADELALAEKPDEDLSVAQKNMDTNDEASKPTDTGSGGGGIGGGGGGRQPRNPNGPKVPAPG